MAILLPSNILHVLAMSAWLGGIAVLVFALRSATSELAPEQRTPLLAGTIARFSALATIALPVLILSGVVQSIIEVGSFPALLGHAVRALGADQDRGRARDRRHRLLQPPEARPGAQAGRGRPHQPRPRRAS